MRHLAEPTVRPRSLKRLLAGTMSTLMAASGLVAVSLAAPVAPAAPANAAEPFTCVSGTVYGTSAGNIHQIDVATGASTLAYDSPSSDINQLALSPYGEQMFWISRDGTPQVQDYTPATEERVSRSVGNLATAAATMGGFDPSTGLFVFGRVSGSTLQVSTYDPETQTVDPTIIEVALPTPPGTNGDLAFGGDGTLYVVAGGTTSQLYRITGGLQNPSALEAAALGGSIDQSAVNSIAFADDGYLYLGSGQGITKVHPSSGASEPPLRFSGTVSSITDFASCATPFSGSAVTELDGPRVDPTDQFELVIRGGQIPENGPGTTTTTTGTGETLDDNVAGPVVVLPGDVITVEQRLTPGSASTPDDYRTEWTCTSGGTVLASGTGSVAEFTMPAGTAGIGADARCSFTTTPLIGALELTKTATPDVVTAIGETVTYELVARNSGTVPATGVTIEDPMTGLSELSCSPAQPAVLEPGEALRCTATRAATAADFQAGSIVNDAEVTGTTERGSVSDAATEEVVADRTPPAATDDVSTGNALGTAVTVEVPGNDGTVDARTVRIIPADGEPVTRLTVPGEGAWSVDETTGAITFTPEAGFTDDPTPITYEIAGPNGIRATATVTVDYVPGATDDTPDPAQLEQPVRVPVLGNDVGGIDPATIAIFPPGGTEPLEPGAPLAVPGEGTWTIDPATGDITFTPEDGYLGNPTPIEYRGEDPQGNATTATVTVVYAPEALDDTSAGNEAGTPVSLDPLANDRGTVDADTFAFVDPETGDPLAPGAELVVPGQGTWSYEPGEGATFTPETGFLTDPTPVGYVVEGPGGSTGSTIAVEYAPHAAADEDLGNMIGEPVTIDVLANDVGTLDPATVQLIDPATGEPLAPGERLTVPGEGEWSIDRATGAVTFVPEDGFATDPSVVSYRVTDDDGETATASITIDYVPAAADDESLGNALGAAAAVTDVLGNDAGELDASTFAFIDPATGAQLAAGAPLIVAGEGTWSFDATADTVTFTPLDGYEGDPTPVDYRVTDVTGDETGATITVGYVPAASDDVSRDNRLGTAVTVDVLANDAGELDPATVALIDAATGEPLPALAPLTVPGEGTWFIDPESGAITFTPEDGYVGDPTPVDYVVHDRTGDATTATVTVDYAPFVRDDESLGNTIGQPVTIPVLGNDEGDLDPATVAIVPPGSDEPLAPGEQLEVPGEGVWTIDPETGAITFTPEPGFLVDPTPIGYVVEDRSGTRGSATVAVDFAPVANDDEDLANEFGETVTIDVLANDEGDFDLASLALVDPTTGQPLAAGAPLVVAGQGTWSIDRSTGTIAFTPQAGYGGDPDAIAYRVTDTTGDTVEATVTVTYGPTAVDDESRRNPIGSPVAVPVLENDLGEFDPSSVRIVDGEALVTELVVEGEGTWSVDTETGAITFTPEAGFTGNPTPIAYRVTDVSGDVTEATVVVTFAPQGVDDQSVEHEPGTPVTVDPLANDLGDLDPTTVELRDPETGAWVTELVVPGEGTWTVDPETGAITFTPEDGFVGSPTPVEYRVADRAGEWAYGTVSVAYASVPVAPAPEPEQPAPGQPEQPEPEQPQLPETGAELTLWVLLLGLALSAAGVLLVRRRSEA